MWAETTKSWVFMPRRASTARYNEVDDEHKGTNLMLMASEGFEEVKVCTVCVCVCVCVRG